MCIFYLSQSNSQNSFFQSTCPAERRNREVKLWTSCRMHTPAHASQSKQPMGTACSLQRHLTDIVVPTVKTRTTRMATNHEVTSSGASLQMTTQHEHHRHLGHPKPTRLQVPSPIINPKRGTDGATQTQAPKPPRACSTPGSLKTCWNLDMKVAVLLVTIAGAVILLLLYRLLRLRHRYV